METLCSHACCCPFPQRWCPLPRGASGQPLLTLAHPQRFQKATQPLRSWRTATAQDVAENVINVPFTITLTSSDFTVQPHGSSED